MADPITLEQAKKHLEVQHDDDDDMIADMLAAAIDHVETVTGKNLSEKEVEQEVATFGRYVRLARRPVQQVVRVEYDPSVGGLPIAFAGHRLLNDRLYLAAGYRWPSAIGARLTYVAGYKPGEMPAGLGRAALLVLGEFYKNREAGSLSPDAERAIASLLRPHRRYGL